MPSTWLLGMWKSDKEATIAAWGKHPPRPEGFRTMLMESLGKLVQRYTAKRSYAGFEGSGSWASYRVLWESKDCLFLVYGARKDERGLLLTFASPSQYWVHVGRYVEYFSKQSDA